MHRQFSRRQLPGAPMSLQQSPTITAERSGARNGSETRLRERRLVLVRAAWVVITLVILGLNSGAIPHYHVVLQTACPASANCFGNQLTSRQVQELHALGGSLRAFATVTVAVR